MTIISLFRLFTTSSSVDLENKFRSTVRVWFDRLTMIGEKTVHPECFGSPFAMEERNLAREG